MLADACALGADVDGHQVELPEAAQVAAPCHRDVERRPNLDAASIAGAGHLVGEPFDTAQLAGEESEEGIGLPAGAAVQLDLLHQLVRYVVHLLFGGNDVEYIDDECNQDHSHQNVDKAADIRGVASFGQQEPFQFLFQ